jgi:hypothetical protein
MENRELDKIIEKIRKCLALATSPNENEAQRAAQKAHELLIRYNLSMQQVEHVKSEYEEKKVDEKIFRKAVEKYVDSILINYFFVKVYNYRTPNAKWGMDRDKASWYNTNTVILGTKGNVEIAHYVRMYLVNTFQDLWKDYKRRTSAPPREEQSYYMGLYKGLTEKLRSQTSRIETEMGLVVIPDPELEARVAEMKNQKERRPDLYSESLSAGYEDGKKIEIKRGITSEGKESGKYLQ